MPHDGPTPAVSVLMPVYNGALFLAEAIDSILGQTITDFEFVVIDDGSTDASPAILADYAARDPRVRIIRQPNAGIVAALNRGLEECRAPLVARMDADDVSLPGRFAAQMRYLADHPDVVAVGTAFQLIADDRTPGPVIRHPTAPNDVARGLRSANRLAHSTVMMRRDAVLALGGYREALRHAEDYDLWARLSRDHKLSNLSECLLLYRIHGEQVSWAQAEKQALATLAVQSTLANRESDPHTLFDLPSTIDRHALATLGYSDRDYEDAFVACVAGRITACEAVRMTAEATATRNALLALAQSSGSQSMRRSVTARLAWADFVAAWRNHRWVKAIWSLHSCVGIATRDRHLRSSAARWCASMLARR